MSIYTSKSLIYLLSNINLIYILILNILMKNTHLLLTTMFLLIPPHYTKQSNKQNNY